jgi:hypothetical protein
VSKIVREVYHLRVKIDLADMAPQARPNGIRILAIICFVITGFLAVSGGLVAVGTIPLASGRYLLGDYAIWGPALYWLVAAVFVLLGFGLLRRWRFARRLGIVVAALMVATSALPISAAVAYFQILPLAIHGVKIILAVMAIRYLLQPEVVEWFSATFR